MHLKSLLISNQILIKLTPLNVKILNKNTINQNIFFLKIELDHTFCIKQRALNIDSIILFFNT